MATRATLHGMTGFSASPHPVAASARRSSGLLAARTVGDCIYLADLLGDDLPAVLDCRERWFVSLS